MRSPGSGAVFTAAMLLAIALAIGGLAEILTASGIAVLVGLVLILAALGLSAHARKARAGYLYRQKITGLEEWAQGLGQGRKERRRR